MISLVKRIHKLLSTVFIVAFLNICLGSSATFAQTGNVRIGEIKSAGCKRCHGKKGLSTNPDYPNLAGQHEKYLIRTLKDYKTGKRKNHEMKLAVTWLTDSNIKDLAAYYSSIKVIYR